MYRSPAPRPRTRLALLPRVTVKTPCNVPWDSMLGDDKIRFCDRCQKNVHDLSAMTEDEAESFLALHMEDDETCVRFFRRPDGTILTSECAVGAKRKHVRRVLAATAATASLLAATTDVAGDALRAARASHAPQAHGRFEVPRRPLPPPFGTDGDPGPLWETSDPLAPKRHQLFDMSIGGAMSFREDPPVAAAPVRANDDKKHGKAPTIRVASMTTTGGLRDDSIHRVVRQSFARIRACYSMALKSRPRLEGHVSVLFVIDKTGAVLSSRQKESTLPDEGVARCIVRTFAAMSFPELENVEKVTVVYAIELGPE